MRPLTGVTSLAWLAANAYSAAPDCSPQNAACRPCRREDSRLVNEARSGAGLARMSEHGAVADPCAMRVGDGPGSDGGKLRRWLWWIVLGCKGNFFVNRRDPGVAVRGLQAFPASTWLRRARSLRGLRTDP